MLQSKTESRKLMFPSNSNNKYKKLPSTSHKSILPFRGNAFNQLRIGEHRNKIR